MITVTFFTIKGLIMKKIFLNATIVFLVLLSVNAFSLTNFTYKGIAIDNVGQVLPTTNVDVQITISTSAGGVLFQETHNGVTTDQFGGFVVEVGSNSLGGGMANITITADTRIKGETRTAGGIWVLSTMETLSDAMKSSVNDITNFAWGLEGNAGTTAGTNFVGTTDGADLHFEIRSNDSLNHSLVMENRRRSIYRDGDFTITNISTATIVPGNLRGYWSVDLQIFRKIPIDVASGNFSFIGGGAYNRASAHVSTIVSGFSNIASGYCSFIGAGRMNNATAHYTIIPGGSNNTASDTGATISGGIYNTASNLYATISGGRTNTASASYSTIAGGYHNIASDTGATVSGGSDNEASGDFSTIGGGRNNIARDTCSTIAGGYRNIATGDVSTIAGGILNETPADFSTIGGGFNNTASGQYATVPGGYQNIAQSYAETVIGVFATTTPAGNPTSFIPTDKLFHIGNGTSAAARSDAFTVYKNGNATLFGNLYVNSNSATGLNTPVLTDNNSLNIAIDVDDGGIALANNSSLSFEYSGITATKYPVVQVRSDNTLHLGDVGNTFDGIRFHAGGSWRMRLTPNGFLGIGVAIPARTLHVKDVMRLDPQSSSPASPSTGDMYMDDGTNTSTGNPKLMVYDGTTWQECW